MGLSILILEDHDALREVTAEFLRELGHEVRGAAEAESFDELMAAAPADVVVLDVNLPGESGHSVCRRMRLSRPDLGIIMLTARGSALDRVAGYELGADVYLAKPTSNEELAAAIASLARRLRPQAQEEARFELQESSRRLSGPAGDLVLSEAEVRLVRALAHAPGRQLAYWQLMEALGLEDATDAKAALEVRVVRLRRKLLELGAPDPAVHAVRRLGYRLVIPVVVRS
jgi:DNA-binding response OmpR family regulator